MPKRRRIVISKGKTPHCALLSGPLASSLTNSKFSISRQDSLFRQWNTNLKVLSTSLSYRSVNSENHLRVSFSSFFNGILFIFRYVPSFGCGECMRRDKGLEFWNFGILIFIIWDSVKLKYGYLNLNSFLCLLLSHQI